MPPFTLTSQTDSSDRLRPVTWRIWLAWVLVATLDPILYTISATGFGKQISPNAEYRALITTGLLAVSAFSVLAPPIMQGLVLQRIMPKLNVALWFLGILLAGIVWLVLTQGRHIHWLIEAGFRTQSQLQRAALTQHLAGTLNTARILNLPWGPFLLWTIALSALTALVPAWMLGAASGMRRATWLFLAAAISGACASGIVEQIYHMTVDRWPIRGLALNGGSWTERFQTLALRGGVGAVWGATTALVVMLMIRPSNDAKTFTAPIFATCRVGGLALALVAPLLIAVLAHLPVTSQDRAVSSPARRNCAGPCRLRHHKIARKAIRFSPIRTTSQFPSGARPRSQLPPMDKLRFSAPSITN